MGHMRCDGGPGVDEVGAGLFVRGFMLVSASGVGVWAARRRRSAPVVRLSEKPGADVGNHLGDGH